MTQSGQLNKKIIIGNKKWVTDNEGFQSYTLEPIARPWAKVNNITESVSVNNEKESVTQERVTFEIYYREGITKKMYVKFQEKLYQIKGIFNPGFENKMLVLTGERDNSRGDNIG